MRFRNIWHPAKLSHTRWPSVIRGQRKLWAAKAFKLLAEILCSAFQVLHRVCRVYAKLLSRGRHELAEADRALRAYDIRPKAALLLYEAHKHVGVDPVFACRIYGCLAVVHLTKRPHAGQRLKIAEQTSLI